MSVHKALGQFPLLLPGVQWDNNICIIALTADSLCHISAILVQFPQLLLALAVSLVLLWHQSSKDIPDTLKHKPDSNLWGFFDEDRVESSDMGWQSMASVTGQPVTCLNSVGAEVKAAFPWEEAEWHWWQGGSQPPLTDTSHPGYHLGLCLLWRHAGTLRMRPH